MTWAAASSLRRVRASGPCAAYADAGWSPSDVDLSSATRRARRSATPVEFASLKRTVGRDGWRRGQCVLGSVKSTVGHLLTAAGAAGVAKVLSALRERTLPPTANFAAPAPGLDMDESPFRILLPHPRTEPADGTPAGRPRAFGFGGINAHVLLEELISQPSCREGEAPAEPHAPDSGRSLALPNSAASYREGEAPAEPHAQARQEPRPPRLHTLLP